MMFYFHHVPFSVFKKQLVAEKTKPEHISGIISYKVLRLS